MALPRLAVLRLGLGLAAVLCAGCPGSQLKSELLGIKQQIETARQNGAYFCAPRELAMAEAHHDFAEAELRYGNYFPAKEHAETAEKNAKEAVEKSPRGQCVHTERPKPPPRPGDRDGDGILDNVDKCPDEPEDKDNFEDEDGCPEPDNDKDGILDARDKCPNDAEDKDGFEDEDGCPDPDNDQDGLLDGEDQCPTQPGPKENKGCPDGDRDKDGVVDRLDACPDEPGPPPRGCPERKFLVITKEKLELKQKIHFATNKAKIFPDSYDLLNEVVEVLKERPTLYLRIEGHTDSKGKIAKNMVLSDQRAAAVRDYLEKAGIAPERLVSRGYGPTVPIGDNKTTAGREQNRRTEFFILTAEQMAEERQKSAAAAPEAPAKEKGKRGKERTRRRKAR
jgi:outer membrane protein OmpA-like peptidoglycan-associated protein